MIPRHISRRLALVGGVSLPFAARSALAAQAPGIPYNDQRRLPLQQQPLLPPALRPPTAFDDSTVNGNKVGDLWLYQNQLWQALQVAAGDAAWTPVYIGRTLPGDAVASVGLYGTVKLRAAWTGNCMVLTRGSDSATLTVGFVNGYVDEATADAFAIAKGDLAAGTCYVTTLYDQSGNGYDCTQTTLANAPVWTNNRVNGLRAITFNSIETSVNTVSKWLSNATAAFIPNRVSVAAISQQRSSRQTSSVFNIGAGTAIFSTSTYVLGAGMSINAGYSGSIVGHASPAVSLWSQWASSVTGYQNDDSGTFNTSLTGTSATGATIGTNIANGVTPNNGQADMDLVALQIIQPSTQLTAAQVLALRSSLHVLSGIAPQQPDTVWLAQGDSITNGFQASALRGYPANALAAIGRPVKLYNMGVSGITLATKISQLGTTNSDYSTGVVAALSAARNGIISVDLDTNDLTDSTVAATLFASHQSYFASLRTLFPNAKLLEVSNTYRADSDATEQATLATLIGLKQAGWQTYADGLIDFASDPTLGSVAAMNNTLYSPDKLHFTDLGYAILGPIAAKGVASVLR